MEIQRADERLFNALNIPSGITALVGGGGKTSLLFRLGRELAARGSVILTTSTQMFRPENGIPVLENPTARGVMCALQGNPAVFVGCDTDGGKMTRCAIPWHRLSLLADYVLVEADGARRLPVKAPAPHEPVLPPHTRLVLAVAGLDAIGVPICAAAHRPDRYAALLRTDPMHLITPDDIARVLTSRHGQKKRVTGGMRFCIVLNKADDARMRALGLETAALIEPSSAERVLVTSLKTEETPCLF